MPTYRDIAQVRVESGPRIPARIPIVRSGTNGILFPESISLGIDRVSELWTVWGADIPDLDEGAAVILPIAYQDEGILINASREWESLPKGARDWTIKIDGGRDDDSELVLSLGKFQATQGRWPITTGITRDILSVGAGEGTYADNHGSDMGDRPIIGLRVSELSTGGVNYLPTRPTLKDRPIWVDVTRDTGDFAGLVLDADDDIQAQAQKGLQLETAYDPRLEDLDTLIVYGKDSDNVDIVWNLVTTERDQSTMILNLAARIT